MYSNEQSIEEDKNQVFIFKITLLLYFVILYTVYVSSLIVSLLSSWSQLEYGGDWWQENSQYCIILIVPEMVTKTIWQFRPTCNFVQNKSIEKDSRKGQGYYEKHWNAGTHPYKQQKHRTCWDIKKRKGHMNAKLQVDDQKVVGGCWIGW